METTGRTRRIATEPSLIRALLIYRLAHLEIPNFTRPASHIKTTRRAAFIPAIRLLVGLFPAASERFREALLLIPRFVFLRRGKHIKAADRKGRTKRYGESATRATAGTEFPDRAAVHSGSMKSDCLVSLRSEKLPLWGFFFFFLPQLNKRSRSIGIERVIAVKALFSLAKVALGRIPHSFVS